MRMRESSWLQSFLIETLSVEWDEQLLGGEDQAALPTPVFVVLKQIVGIGRQPNVIFTSLACHSCVDPVSSGSCCETVDYPAEGMRRSGLERFAHRTFLIDGLMSMGISSSHDALVQGMNLYPAPYMVRKCFGSAALIPRF